MDLQLAFFIVVALLMIASALGMVLARNMVHGVLFMVGNFVLTAVLYLLLNAPFIAAVQVIVYAGAIMVLFLFVVMLLGARMCSNSAAPPPAGGEPSAWPPRWSWAPSWPSRSRRASPAGTATGVAEKNLPTLAAFGKAGAKDAPARRVLRVAADGGRGLVPRALHLVPFELVSLLLLVAMMGAVVMRSYAKGAAATTGLGPGEKTHERATRLLHGPGGHPVQHRRSGRPAAP